MASPFQPNSPSCTTFQLEVCSRAQTNKITSKRLNQVGLDVNLTPPAGCLNHLSFSGHFLSPVFGTL